MGNVTLPTPVFVAGGVLCLLAGFLVGAVAGPTRPDRTTATVDSFRASTSRLCLVGDGIKGQEGVKDDKLCGVWRRTNGARVPVKGDKFRFASLVTDSSSGSSESKPITVIVGDVVG